MQKNLNSKMNLQRFLPDHSAVIIPFILIYSYSSFVILSLPIYSDNIQQQYNIKGSIISSIQLFMYAIGSIFGGILADLKGRKFTVILLIIIIIVSFFMLLIRNRIIFQISMILIGFCIGPLNNLAFIYISQSINSKYREIYILSLLCSWSISQALSGLLISIIHDYTLFLLYISLPLSIMSLLLIFYFPQTLPFSSYYNKVNNIKLIVKAYLKTFKIFLKKQIIFCILMIFCMQYLYYYSQFDLRNLGLSVSMNIIVIGLFEAVSYISSFFIIPKVKRVISMQISMVIFFIFFISSKIYQNKYYEIIASGICRYFLCIIFGTLAVYLPQLFQVNNRSIGNNLIMAIGILGGSLSTLAPMQYKFIPIIFVLAFFFSFFLEQTKDKDIHIEYS